MPRPAFGLLEVSKAGGLGTEAVADAALVPMGADFLNLSRIALTPPPVDGDVSYPGSCVPVGSSFTSVDDWPVRVVETGAHVLPT